MRISDWSSDVCSSDLREAQLVPLAHDVTAVDLAELVGRQAADAWHQLEEWRGLVDDARFQQGVAIDHRDDGVGIGHVARDRTEALRKPVALAGAGNAHDLQTHAGWRRDPAPEIEDRKSTRLNSS